MGSETKITPAKPFMAPYVMVQKANNIKDLLETNKKATNEVTKEVSKVVATDKSKDTVVSVKDNKSAEIKSSTINSAVDKNKNVLDKTPQPQPVPSNKPSKSAVKVEASSTAKSEQTLS